MALSFSNLNEKCFILASLVADEVINNILEDSGVKDYDAILLLADISGFTELCDKYSRVVPGGSSKITDIINQYLSEIIKLIYLNKGDILNFSGDAFLSIWKIDNLITDDGNHHLIKVVDTAIKIQKNYGAQDIDGNKLRIKLAISMGTCRVTYLRSTSGGKDFILSGDPVLAVKEAEHLCRSGEIVLSPSAAQIILDNYPNKYKTELFVKSHIKLLGSTVEDSFYGEDFKPKFENKSLMERYYDLRPLLKYAVDKSFEKQLKQYMMASILKGLELDQSISELTEMRQVVIAFFNLVTSTVSEDGTSLLVKSCYRIVSKHLRRSQGSLNKVSLFDKDLMFLAVFGLKYFNTSIAAHAGLNCAYAIQKQLSATPDVITASVGVTTGTVYCGIVGHPIRREYTVMGLTVNKAARLMVAYPEKVTCDRETLLHSRMSNQNFSLQEPAYLKGIPNVGPIYRFDPDRVFSGNVKPTENFTMSKAPLLGRQEELQIFDKVFTDILIKFDNRFKDKTPKKGYDPNEIKALWYNGSMRQGKTRIIEEIQGIIGNHAEFSALELSQGPNSPYSTVRLFFDSICDFDDSTSHLTKESKILQLLSAQKFDQNLLCSLNSIFNINFPISKKYSEMTAEKKELISFEAFKQLISHLCKPVHVLIIDNAEFTDDKSWTLLRIFTALDFTLLVLTVGAKHKISKIAKTFLLNKSVARIELTGISKWFLIGLSCQILGARGIPEKVLNKIEELSLGNPGWIEAYLMSLLQSGVLAIKYLSISDIVEKNIILAPKYMLDRNTVRTVEMDQWLIHSRREAHSERRLELDLKESEKTKLEVCIQIGKELIEPPQQMDALVLTVFDLLPPVIQSVLKACSIIGAVFPRDKLVYISPQSDIQLSTSIKKLFDLKILGCASRNATLTHNKLTYRKLLLNVPTDNTVTCYCSKTYPSTDEGTETLPKYAYCNFICFRTALFRETVRSLLTNSERSEFHFLLVSYLKTQVRRCTACGSNDFDHIKTNDSKVCSIQTAKKSLSNAESFLKEFEYYEINRSSVHTDPFENLIRNPKLSIIQIINFSYAPSSDCQCHLILTSYYSELIERCQDADWPEELIKSIVEFVPVRIALHEVSSALQLIDTAKLVIHNNSQKFYQSPDLTEKGKNINCLDGVLKMLQGICHFEMGFVEKAEKHYLKALDCFGLKMPGSTLKTKLKIHFELVKLKFTIIYSQKWLVLKKRSDKQMIMTHGAECLYFLCGLYNYTDDVLKRKLTALWSLSLAMKTGTNFFNLFSIFATIFSLVDVMSEPNFFNSLETFAIAICFYKAERINKSEMRTILNVYNSLFKYRITTGEIEDAIDIGIKTLEMSVPTERLDITLEVLPRLVLALLHARKLKEATQYLAKLEALSESDSDESGRAWCLALPMILTLTTGLDLASPQDLMDFLKNQPLVLRDEFGLLCLRSALWLALVRQFDWNKARFVFPDSQHPLTMDPYPLLMIFEGLLIYFAKCPTVKYSAALELQIRSLKRVIEKRIEKYSVYKPRFLHLQAYWLLLNSLPELCIKDLKEAKHLSTVHKNELERCWIDKSFSTWFNKKPSATCDPKFMEKVEWNGKIFYEINFYQLPPV